ncbi:unnamed protein product [Polarella glacialis]|uniref:PH domain-containing protein n=1 Tax=Polarella glacialis TaxID=89957 RepID=A0A813JQP4_POLGL|nr:unnamed protein product [Polarella glacialis]
MLKPAPSTWPLADGKGAGRGEMPLSELSPDGWLSHEGAGGRTFWHHKGFAILFTLGEVYRLTAGAQGWKRHDCRSLLLAGSKLHIFDKGSQGEVKTVLDVASGDVAGCTLLGSGVLSLELRRQRRLSLLRSAVSGTDDTTKERKLYFFEFTPPSLAATFQQEIEKRQRSGRKPSD